MNVGDKVLIRAAVENVSDDGNTVTLRPFCKDTKKDKSGKDIKHDTMNFEAHYLEADTGDHAKQVPQLKAHSTPAPVHHEPARPLSE